MTKSIVEASARPDPDTAPVVQTVTVIMGIVVGLTFLFGFGNVLNLALRLGIPTWVAPLVAPAVDLSILGLLLGTRHLALHGATPEQLRPARRLLIFASLTTLALNIADPLITSAYGKAAFDAVGPLLLIGWAEVGPGLLQAISTISPQLKETIHANSNGTDANTDATSANTVVPRPSEGPASDTTSRPVAITPNGDLLDRARHEDARHWTLHQRPISAETLRKKLRISATRSRELVSVVRAEQSSDRTAAAVAAGQSASG
ncbi:hypothetical protein [Amycolatopsis sp. H20-H5]|uniref:hypothetical protein n=1 Tax=Amycolatopsis sp. H20-H5 TaxID=3046309 RepID=UPI002DBC42F8|nr:hypothetical protein [Amycolatopsis sp. H20-H5]MEC3978726.1 hypothetical protein [Amycolatopsis sp. H20-H5]